MRRTDSRPCRTLRFSFLTLDTRASLCRTSICLFLQPRPTNNLDPIARICLVAALDHPRLAHDSSTQVAAPHNPDANPSVDGDGDRQHGRIHIAHSPCSSYSPSSTCHPQTQYPASSIPPDALPHCLSPPISDIDSRRISEAVERLSCDDHGPLCLHPRLPLQNCRHGPMFDPGVSHSLIHVSATAPYLRPYLVSTNRQMIHNPLPEPLLSDARPG